MREGATDLEIERKAVAAVWQRAIDALAACDWEAYASLWAHEPYVEALHPAQGSWWTGWEEVGHRYRGILEQGVSIRGETHEMHIHVGPSRDVAWAAMDPIAALVRCPRCAGVRRGRASSSAAAATCCQPCAARPPGAV